MGKTGNLMGLQQRHDPMAGEIFLRHGQDRLYRCRMMGIIIIDAGPVVASHQVEPSSDADKAAHCFLHRFVSDPAILKTDTMVLQKCALLQWPVLAGILAATLSSAIGSLLAAPRVVQALAQDRVLPRFVGRGYGSNNDPRVATALTFALAATGIWMGDINAIAPVLTMFNLTTYGLLNLCAGLEEMMGNPSWRPTFRVKSVFSFAGFLGCMAMMFMISPGWTFVAIAFEILVYWVMKRRAVRAHRREGEFLEPEVESRARGQLPLLGARDGV